MKTQENQKTLEAKKSRISPKKQLFLREQFFDIHWKTQVYIVVHDHPGVEMEILNIQH